MLHTNRSLVDGGGGQINIDMALKNANAKLSQWTAKWEHEMRRGEGRRPIQSTLLILTSKRRIVPLLVPQSILFILQPLLE